jgi:CubicO group peptidase (beta-lactamase class C family)
MDHTFYELSPSDRRLASGYTTFVLSEPELVAPESMGWLGGAGGIYSTPTDLAKWDLALIEGRVLKPESYVLMTAPRKLSDGKLAEYGCGLAVRIQSGREVISHNGAVSGFNTWNSVVPSTHSAVIMTCNVEGGLGSLPSQIFSLLLKEPTNVPAISGPPASETVKKVFAELQKGKINRQQFAEEFNHYLTDQKIAGASRRLKPFGTPLKAEVTSTHERGGMEVSMTRLTFKRGTLQAQMYRTPDGRIEQFFVSQP